MAGRNQYGLGPEDLLHFDKGVGYKCAAGRNYVEDGVGYARCRSDLHRAGDHFYLSVDILGLEEGRKDVGVGGGDALPLEPL